MSRQAAAVDLTAWQGRAAAVVALLREELVNVLNGLAGTMDTLAGVCSTWAR